MYRRSMEIDGRFLIRVRVDELEVVHLADLFRESGEYVVLFREK